jgi:putative tricarboxylic transport membrane protein
MDVLIAALIEMAEPLRLAMLVLGVLLGLMVGVIPGIGGIFGLTILIPITYGLDPISAFALLLGMASVTTTSDTIPAVLIGVPGTVGAAATVVDGHEMAKNGQAAQALGAAYTASMIGGVFGAVMLALSIPVMRPLVLMLNYGDLFAITVFGLTLVALLSGSNWIKGLLAAHLGALVAYIGIDPYEGVERWTFGQVYLWDGVPVAVVFLGLFALPELAGVLARGQIQTTMLAPEPGGLLRGIREALRHWRLVLRSGSIGAFLGAIPGVGVVVIEWVAYGDAARARTDAVAGEPAYGKGNIRGVIAPESANNAKEGGSLLPTLAFGIPGSASMAILLGAFAVHGVVPGPKMLEDNATLLVTMILTVALANVLGALICLGLTPWLARLARVPATSLVPLALVFVGIGAFYAAKDWRDLLLLGIFGLLGLVMRRLGWSRPAFALGFVLAPNLERFFFLSWQISGWNWLTQPVVLIFLAIAATTVLRQSGRLAQGARGERTKDTASKLDLGFTAAVLIVVLVAGGSLLGAASGGCDLSGDCGGVGCGVHAAFDLADRSSVLGRGQPRSGGRSSFYPDPRRAWLGDPCLGASGRTAGLSAACRVAVWQSAPAGGADAGAGGAGGGLCDL